MRSSSIYSLMGGCWFTQSVMQIGDSWATQVVMPRGGCRAPLALGQECPLRLAIGASCWTSCGAFPSWTARWDWVVPAQGGVGTGAGTKIGTGTRLLFGSQLWLGLVATWDCPNPSPTWASWNRVILSRLVFFLLKLVLTSIESLWVCTNSFWGSLVPSRLSLGLVLRWQCLGTPHSTPCHRA